MNSIKNAIVTITLLAVGYGSYVVLQDPAGGQLSSSLPQDETTVVQQDLPGVQIDVIPPQSQVFENPIVIESTQGDLAGDRVPGSGSLASDVVVAPELPPLPELIDPSGEARDQATVAVDAQNAEPVPLEARASEPAPSPVSALVPPANAVSDSAIAGNGPFSKPVAIGVAETRIDAASDTAVPKTNTAPKESLDLFPPIDRSIGPIPPETSEDGSSEFENAWAEAQQQLRHQELAAALRTLTPWLSELTLNREQQNRCIQLLDQLAGTVVYSRDHYLAPAHAVQAGETLEEISVQYSVPTALLAKINGIAPPYALTTGETLKIIRGPFQASVSLFKSELTLVVDGCYGGRFPVTIGRDLPPEPALYEVAEKSNGRSYFDRRLGREVIRAEDGNRYGNHWLGLRGEHITAGHSVGIHGRPVKFSRDDVGSISLDPIDAEDVYSILSVGSQVEVRP